MTNQDTIQATEADAASMAEKLAQFAQTLSGGEAVLLRTLISCAAQVAQAQAQGEVQGYFTLIEVQPFHARSVQPVLIGLLNVAGPATRAMGDGSVRLPAVQSPMP